MAGTATMGSDTNSYSTLYRSLHTPSSSPETYSFVRSSPARSVGSAPNLVDRTVETPAPSKHGGLRTPADSGALKLDSKLQAAAAKAAEFHSQLDKHEAAIQSRPSFQLLPLELQVEPDMAKALEERLGDEHGLKLDYDHETKILFVTYPTDVHESFKVLVSPYTHIISEDGATFASETNADIRVRVAGGIVKTRVPDFAFAKLTNGANPRPEYGIVFESSYSERSTHVKDKTTNWFSVPSILGVVILKFEIGTLSSPATTPPSPGAVPDTFQDFAASASKPRGPIRYKGGTWAPLINEIQISVYYRDTLDASKSHGVKLNVTPGTADVTTNQETVVAMLEILTRRFMGEEAFNRIYPNKGDFNIDWSKFYAEVTRRLLTDGYERYCDWVRRTGDPTFKESTVITRSETGLSSLKRMRENFGLGVDDDEKDRLSKLFEPKK